MGIKLAALGSFLTIIGSLGVFLSLLTDVTIFEPVIGPILTLVVGTVLLVIGLRLSS